MGFRAARALVFSTLAGGIAAVHGACLIAPYGVGDEPEAGATVDLEAGVDAGSADAMTQQPGTCPAGHVICKDSCTDTMADPANCGGCGKPCAAGNTCTAGVCTILCTVDTSRCGDQCFDTSSDTKHCGGCTTDCTDGGMVCASGRCSTDCNGAANTLCPNAGDGGGPGYCADLSTDRNNCGSCGKTCGTGAVCVAKVCKPLCAAGAKIGDVFSPTMTGCTGTITYNNRATLCPSGSTVCTAAQWVARRSGKKPTFDYWTSDNLGYTGTSASCAATLSATVGSCSGMPMRVCSGGTDPLGNQCRWTNCGYQNVSPTQYFGGCTANTTAGTLCCTP